MKQLIFYALLFFAFAANVRAEGVKKEAEAAKYSKCEVVSDNKYSGKKALRLTEQNAQITFAVDVETKGKYTLFIAGEGVGGEKQVNCAVNGDKCQFKLNKYGEVEIGTFMFREGANEVIVTPNWTWFCNFC